MTTIPMSNADDNATSKCVFAVPLSDKACWQDFAYLAAIPAGVKVNTSNPAVVALNQFASIRPEMTDFLKRYKPSKVFLMDCGLGQKPSTKGLVAYWPMDDAKGGRCSDTVGRAHGKWQRSPVWKTQGSSPYWFDGQTLHVKSGGGPGSGRALTVAFWMKADGNANQTVMSKISTVVDRRPGWEVMLRTKKEKYAIRFRIGGGNGGWMYSDVIARNAYKPGEWVHVACTHENGTSKIYINGALKATRENITFSTPDSTLDPLMVGGKFTGVLDDVRIYHRALDLINVQQLPGSVGASHDRLVAYWPMDETEGTTAHDKVGEFHLTAKGTVSWEEGKIKGGVRFAKRGDHLRIGGVYNAKGSFSVRFVARSNAPQKCCLARKSSVFDHTAPWSFHLDGTDLIFRIGNCDPVTAKDALKPGTKVNVGTTCQGNDVKLYVNGKVTDASTVKWQGDIKPPTGSDFDGELENLCFYEGIQTPEEMEKAESSRDGLLVHVAREVDVGAEKKEASWTEGVSNGGLFFNGINESVVCKGVPATSDEMTVAFWAKPEAAGCLISRIPYEKAGPGWALTIPRKTNALRLMLSHEKEVTPREVGRTTEAFVPDTWTHITVTMKGKRATLYVNGEKRSSWRIPKDSLVKNAASPIVIGSMPKNNDPFKGRMDEVRIYNKALTKEEVLAVTATEPILPATIELVKLPAKSPGHAACSLASKFWSNADTIICCKSTDYSSALLASGLAARLRAPLLYWGDKGFSAETRKQIKRLNPRRIVSVGRETAPALDGVETTQLTDAIQALKWMHQENVPVNYFAAANPQDRVIKNRNPKVSLISPLLAAGRSGAVAPLDFTTEWGVRFNASTKTKEQVKGTPESIDEWKFGELAINGETRSFVVTSTAKGQHRLNILKPDGTYEGPYATADRVTIGDRTYTISLHPGTHGGLKAADVRLFWPGPEEICARLTDYYKALGRHPEYLCIVGKPDVIPHAIIRRWPGGDEDLTSDFPLANADDDLFAELAFGRLAGDDLYSASLTAARCLVYEDLFDPSWTEWAATAGQFPTKYDFDPADIGFKLRPHHTGEEGKMDSKSPLCNTALICHGEHSGHRGMGGMYASTSRVLLAPTFVDSTGCSVMNLDQDAFDLSVPMRLLRNGAVGVIGSARFSTAPQSHTRSEFWNGLIQGMTVGQAHRHSLNRALALVFDKNPAGCGGLHYQLYIKEFYGDPALQLKFPGTLAVKPAYLETAGLTVTFHGPEKWQRVAHPPPRDWGKCKYKTLYRFRGYGVGLESYWSGKINCNKTEYYYAAEVHTKETITGIEQLDTPPKPLGWDGKFYIDEHQDGTRSIYWFIKPIVVDVTTGKVLKQVDTIKFKLKKK